MEDLVLPRGPASPAELERAVGSAPWSVVLLDPAGRVEYVNPHFSELTGLDRDELHGLDWFDVAVPERRRAAARSAFRAVVEGAAAASRVELVLGRDGAEIPIEWSHSPLGDGQGGIAAVLALGLGAAGGTGAAGAGASSFARFLSDVSDAVAAAAVSGIAAAQGEAEERFSKAFYRNPIGMAIRHIASDLIVDANPSYERLTGYARGELVGRTIEELGLYLRSDDRLAARAIVDQGGRLQDYAFDLRTKSGEIRRVLMSIDPIVLRGERCTLASFADVTELTEAQEALRRSEERLREAVQVAQIGIFVHEHATDAMYWSPELRETYGVGLDEEATIPLFLDLLHPDDRDEIGAALQRAHDPAGDGRFDVEHRIVRRDGNVRWVTTKSQTIFGRAGKVRRPVRSVGAVQDITDRAVAEQELRESRERYRALFEQAGVGVAEMETATGRIVMANARYAEMLGYTPEELQHLSIADIVDPDDRGEVAEERAAFLRDDAQPYHVERKLLCKDGSHLWASVSVVALPRHEDEPAHEVAVVVDVTDRRRAELALRQINRRLVDIVDGALEGIVTVDAEQRIRVFSHAAEEMFGRAAEEVVGRPLDLLLPEQHRIVHREHVARYAETGDKSRAMGTSMRLSGLHADGSEFPIEATISRTSGDGGAAILTVFIRDITERERARELQEQLMLQLEEARRMEAIGTLASGIAHDFNNILGAILGNAELALRQHGLDQSARDRLDDVVRAGRRGAQLVDQILAFARHDREARYAIQVAPVVREAARLAVAGLRGDVTLEADVADDVPAVVASEAEIHQVVTNLCVNALQAIGERPGTVRVQLDAVRFGDDARDTHADLRPGLYARLAVSDTGPGMDAAVRDRIFEPFFTTKEVGRGTGLGLSVVHGIVRACGGAIMVASRPEEGTAFSLFFPASTVPAGREPEPERTAIPEAAVAGTRVLYVDDEEALASFGERLLETLGYRVTALTDPVEALAAIEAGSTPFDLVVADVTMPRLSGVELARRIRSQRPELPIVLMSGFVSDELRVRAAELGVRHVLAKPMALAELAGVVAELTAPAPE